MANKRENTPNTPYEFDANSTVNYGGGYVAQNGGYDVQDAGEIEYPENYQASHGAGYSQGLHYEMPYSVQYDSQQQFAAYEDSDVQPKKRSNVYSDQPYSNMRARKVVLILGILFALIGLAVAVVSCLFMFVASIKVPSELSPSKFILGLLIAAVATEFAATIFTVAGANTSKGMASLAMFIEVVTFIIGAAMLVLLLLFRTILPLDAFDRLAESATRIML